MKPQADRLSDTLLVSWYGDDFTGASAVMEVLTLAGLPSVLFLEPPTPELLSRFSNYRGLGVAGIARSKSPQWMEAHLPEVFKMLSQWGAPIVHYKVCSTFDSSPQIGSIGKAIELATEHFEQEWIPVLIAAPAIHRYQLFGNLFAACDGVGYRLDRHPAMSRHPITPMAEADVCLHLSRQTTLPVGLVDYPALAGQHADKALDGEISARRRVIALDTIDERTLAEAGRLIWNRRSDRLFVAGSQGIEYALVAYWRSVGVLPSDAGAPSAPPVDRIAVVSGSCSPITATQIKWAQAHGFELIRIDARRALNQRDWQRTLLDAADAAVRAIDGGRDPLVYSACGPDDDAVKTYLEAIDASGQDAVIVNETLGRGLGEILAMVVRRTHVRRGVLAGGDTSGYGMKALGFQALTLAAPIVTGAALFRAHSNTLENNDVEIALKGGQMGPPDYFGRIKSGGRSAEDLYIADIAEPHAH